MWFFFVNNSVRLNTDDLNTVGGCETSVHGSRITVLRFGSPDRFRLGILEPASAAPTGRRVPEDAVGIEGGVVESLAYR